MPVASAVPAASTDRGHQLMEREKDRLLWLPYRPGGHLEEVGFWLKVLIRSCVGFGLAMPLFPEVPLGITHNSSMACLPHRLVASGTRLLGGRLCKFWVGNALLPEVVSGMVCT